MAINWKPNMGLLKKAPKIAGIASLVAAGAVALPFIISGSRESRRYDPSAVPPPPAEPLPQVMMAPEAPEMQQNTLMGQQPVEGDNARRVLAQRGGMAAGIDPSNPRLMDVDGSGQVPGVLGR